MKSGIELITIERHEQIVKHGFDQEHDRKNMFQELKKAAIFALDAGNPICMNMYYPTSWADWFSVNIFKKSEIERLTVAGALIAAEIDRLQALLEVLSTTPIKEGETKI